MRATSRSTGVVISHIKSNGTRTCFTCNVTVLLLQVRERLLDPYYHQWLQDTEELLEKLPCGLDAPEQSLPLSLTFERWLLQLKVMLTAALSLALDSVEAAL